MGAPLRESVPPPGRGRRALAGLRYAPLVVLLVCVVVVTLVGRIERGSEDTRGRQASTPTSEPTLPAVCAPPVDQGLSSQPWRDTLARPASRKAFDTAIRREHPSYVEGRDGWLFFTDEQADDFSQALGRKRLRSSQIDAWSAYFAAMKKAAEARGSQFYVMIAPAKWDVYPEKLPAWTDELRGTNSLDLLMQRHPELPFIDVRAPLRAADEPTYSPLNSHWTNYGGHVAWKAATACLRAADQGNRQLRAVKLSGVDTQADLNEYAPQGVVQTADQTRTEPVYADRLPPTTVTSIPSGDRVDIGKDGVIDMTLLPVQTRTPGARSDQTALVLRDSTGSALSPELSSTFAKTFQYRHLVDYRDTEPVDVAALIDEHRPDITLFTMTERHLAYGAPGTPAKP